MYLPVTVSYTFSRNQSANQPRQVGVELLFGDEPAGLDLVLAESGFPVAAQVFGLFLAVQAESGLLLLIVLALIVRSLLWQRIWGGQRTCRLRDGANSLCSASIEEGGLDRLQGIG